MWVKHTKRPYWQRLKRDIFMGRKIRKYQIHVALKRITSNARYLVLGLEKRAKSLYNNQELSIR